MPSAIASPSAIATWASGLIVAMPSARRYAWTIWSSSLSRKTPAKSTSPRENADLVRRYCWMKITRRPARSTRLTSVSSASRPPPVVVVFSWFLTGLDAIELHLREDVQEVLVILLHLGRKEVHRAILLFPRRYDDAVLLQHLEVVPDRLVIELHRFGELVRVVRPLLERADHVRAVGATAGARDEPPEQALHPVRGHGRRSG